MFVSKLTSATWHHLAVNLASIGAEWCGCRGYRCHCLRSSSMRCCWETLECASTSHCWDVLRRFRRTRSRRRVRARREMTRTSVTETALTWRMSMLKLSMSLTQPMYVWFFTVTVWHDVIVSFVRHCHGWILYWPVPQMWPPLAANKDGRPTGSNFIYF